MIDAFEINRFFEKIKIENDSVNPIKPYFNVLDSFSRLIGQSFYIVDYLRHGFVYVSSNPLFLCGHKVEDVLSMGYTYYKKVVVEDDLRILMEIDKKGYEFFSRLSFAEKMKSVISFDFRLLQPGSRTIMVNQKKTPIFLPEDGSIRFALCVINLSPRNDPGNVVVKVGGVLQNFVYSFEGKKWKPTTKIKITNREKEVLQLSIQGCSNEEISKILFVDVSTVKFHKTNIYSKLDVKNIAEAITFAHNNNLV